MSTPLPAGAGRVWGGQAAIFAFRASGAGSRTALHQEFRGGKHEARDHELTAPLEQLTIEDWDQTICINLRGTFLTIKATLPALRERGGSIVVTSSVNGTRMFSNAGASAYATTKAGQVALVKMLAVELARYRIRVNAICPGAIATDIEQNTEERSTAALAPRVEFPDGRIPLTSGRPGSPEQVAQLVLFLASAASDHITGTEIFIDGAQSLLEG